MLERGRIRSRKFALVERDFTKLRWGKITPTDIDGFLEFGDRLFVFIEHKFGGAAVVGGQRLAIQRLVDACHMPPRRMAAAVVIDHVPEALLVEEDGSERIDYSVCRVREVYAFGRFRQQKQDLRCKQAIDHLIAMSARMRARRVK